MKLLSLSEFILRYKPKGDTIFERDCDFREQVIRNTMFLRKKLSIEMFTICDEKLVPMLYPPGSGPTYTHSDEYLESYQRGTKNVFFSGYELETCDINGFLIKLKYKDVIILNWDVFDSHFFFYSTTIEDANLELMLNNSTQKMLGYDRLTNK